MAGMSNHEQVVNERTGYVIGKVSPYELASRIRRRIAKEKKIHGDKLIDIFSMDTKELKNTFEIAVSHLIGLGLIEINNKGEYIYNQ